MNPTSIFRVFGKSALGRRFTIITLMFLSVLLGIMIYTTTTIQKEKSNAHSHRYGWPPTYAFREASE